jgi:hypothetical protein
VIADIWFILYILSIPSCIFVLDGRDSLDIAHANDEILTVTIYSSNTRQNFANGLSDGRKIKFGGY